MTPDIGSIFKDFTPGTYGIWLIVAMVAVALIKVWPVLALQAIQAKDRIRGEDRTDLNDCKVRLDEMAKRIDALVETVGNLKIELAGTLSAYRVLDIAEERRDPTSVHLLQARAILSAAFTIAPSTTGTPHEFSTQPEKD